MGSPYLKENRLADVIAAITTLATYKFYKLDFPGWADRISGSENRAAHWEQVFREHPEFFRISSADNKASLVWRRQYPRTYNVDTGVEEAKPEGQKYLDGERYSRRPLEPTEITALISTAVNLHSRAVEQSNSARWWLPILIAVLAFAGSLVGGVI